MQNWLSDNLDMLWSKDFWTPNCSDLNPLSNAFGAWSKGFLTRRGTLMSHISSHDWGSSIHPDDSALLKRACERFRLRMEAVIAADEGYIE